MYDVIQNIIGYEYNYNDPYGFVAAGLIYLLSVVFIDMVYRIFRHFWR